MLTQDTFTISTRGRGTTEITDRVNQLVAASGIATGLCNIFIQHTSASLVLCENADPAVRADLERFMRKQVVDGDPMFSHTAEGEDDMSAHVRSVLTDSAVTVPVAAGRCLLGTWQGIYLWEHRYRGHQRRITVTVYGD